MLRPLRYWSIAARFPGAFRAPALYRAALMAASHRDYEDAERLFEAAAMRYRRDLMVPALARLRVRQLMARFEASRDRDGDAALDMGLEIERRLRCLDWIEDLAPPFARVASEELLERWTDRSGRPLSVAA
jgi:hypothetical protein